jgi:hypothetical protein
VWAQHHFASNSITYSTIINKNGTALYIEDDLPGPNLIDHNTFVGMVGVGSRSILIIEDNQAWYDTTTITNNIFYSTTADDAGGYGSAVSYDASRFDSTFFDSGSDYAGHLVSDHNLYSYYGAYASVPDTAGKRSIRFKTDASQYAWPGKHISLRAATALADSVTIEPGVFADSVSVVAGEFADSVIIHFHPTLNDTTFTAYVGREVVRTPSSGKLAVVRTVKTAPTSGKIAAAITATVGDFLTSGPWAKWCPACDDSSRYGSPMFIDSTNSPVDVRPGFWSLARGGAAGGGTIGALAALDVFEFVVEPNVVVLSANSDDGVQDGFVLVSVTGTDTTKTCTVDSIRTRIGSDDLGSALEVVFNATGPDSSFHVPSTQSIEYSYGDPDNYPYTRTVYKDFYFNDALGTVLTVAFIIQGAEDVVGRDDLLNLCPLCPRPIRDRYIAP